MPFDYTGSFSGSFYGVITASNGIVSSSTQVTSLLPTGVVSASAQITSDSGLISSSRQINYRDIQNQPKVISAFERNSISANKYFRETTYPLDSASFSERLENVEGGSDSASFASRITDLEGASDSDSQTLSFNSSTNALTISNGNSVDLSSLSGGGGGSGLALTASNEGVTLSENVRSIDFVGNGVTATNSGNAVTVTINTSSAGGSTDISSLNSFTSSIQTEVDSLTAATSSYLTSVPDGTVSGSAQITDVITDSYISASAAASGFGSGGGGGTTYSAGLGIDITSNVISINTSSTHFRLGVSASAAYYGFSGGGGGSFGDPPTIDQDGLQIREFTGSGAYVGTLTVTDVTPGDTATWATQSGYSAGYFGISTDGVVRVLSTTTASMNTSAASGSNLSHPFLIKVTDGQNNTVEGTIYIYVIPNEAPKFRQTSVNGSIITAFTASSLNENSTAGTTAATIYFTDAEGDTITIGSGSWSVGDSSHFTITKNATNVVITQATASLDYETYTHYQLYLTASDSKYPLTDPESVSYLPVRIPVEDNDAPTLANQTLTGVNENSADATSAGTVTITDTEGDSSATIVSMTLKSAYINGVGTNVTSSMGGTSLYDPHSDPFTFSGKTIIRKNGVYLNSDIANRYEYTVGVQDKFNTDINYGVVTIPIANDAASAVSDNWTNVYVIESATSGDSLYTNSNGRTGTVAAWSSAASQRWSVSSDGDLVEVTSLTGSSTQLRLKADVSGSIYSYDGTSTINVALTASEHGFETTKQYVDLAVNVAINTAPDIVFIVQSDNINTNLARVGSGNILMSIGFSDTEGDSIDQTSFEFSSSAALSASYDGGQSKWHIYPTIDLPAATYPFTASIQDVHRFRTNSESGSFGITQAPVGGITSNGGLYIIESAESGSHIVISSSGFQGSQSDLGVTYSPVYGGAAVQSFTSSNAMLHVTNTGLLSLDQDISGSGTGSGDSFTSLITWRDQYDNVGSSTITITVTENQAPFVSKYVSDSNNRNTNLATSGTRLARMYWKDYEGDTIDGSTLTLSGAGASSLSASYSAGTSSIFANSSLTATTYGYTASISTTNGFTAGEYEDTITIAQAGGGTLTKSGNFYIIESATASAAITTTTSGIAGTQAYVGVAYSPNYGSQVAEQFNFGAGHPYLDVDTNTGYLVLGQNISGSAYQNGSSIAATIYWEDQYGNPGTGSFTVNVTNDQDPSATFSTQTLNAPVTSGTLVESVTLSDPEGATPFSMSLSGVSANSMSLDPQNAASSSYNINLSQTIAAGLTLNYTASVFDAYNQETQYKRSVVVNPPSSAAPLWYLYTSQPGQYATTNEATYLQVYGDANDDGSTDSGYPFDDLTGGEIGSTSFTSTAYTGFGDTNTLVASGSILSGSNTTPLISNLNHTNLGFMIVFPSSSEVGINPSSMTNALGGSTTNQYVLFADRPGTGALNDNPQTSYVRYFDLDSGTYPDSSATRFGVIFVGGGSSNITYFLMASSGSAPSSTQ